MFNDLRDLYRAFPVQTIAATVLVLVALVTGIVVVFLLGAGGAFY
jgi:hypothetical protein